MDFIEEMREHYKIIVCRLKTNFMEQLLASRAAGVGGGMTLKRLKGGAVREGYCLDTFNISPVINELIQEGKATVELIGDDPYLWLLPLDSSLNQSGESNP